MNGFKGLKFYQYKGDPIYYNYNENKNHRVK